MFLWILDWLIAHINFWSKRLTGFLFYFRKCLLFFPLSGTICIFSLTTRYNYFIYSFKTIYIGFLLCHLLKSAAPCPSKIGKMHLELFINSKMHLSLNSEISCKNFPLINVFNNHVSEGLQKSQLPYFYRKT